MKKEQYHYDYVYVIHDFLDESECQAYIALAESLGFDDAPITTSGGAVIRKDVRNNTRVMKDDLEAAKTCGRESNPGSCHHGEVDERSDSMSVCVSIATNPVKPLPLTMTERLSERMANEASSLS